MIIIIIVVIIILSYFIYPTPPPPLYGAFQIIYQAWDTVFYHQMKHWEESWKYDVQQGIFDELRGISSGDETLCWMFDITFETKWFYKEKSRIQKWAVFHFQTLINH